MPVGQENITKTTISGYQYFLRQFTTYTGDIDTAELDPTHIRGFMATQMERRTKYGAKLSSSSVFKCYSVVRTFVRWLYNQYLTIKCITDKTRAPKIENYNPESLSDEEVSRIMHSLTENSPFRKLVIFQFFLDTGCRLSEVPRINLDDVNFEQGCIKVFGKGRKEGYVFMGERLRENLQIYIDKYRHAFEDEKALFVTVKGNRFTTQGMLTFIRKILAAHHIKGKHGPHKLRHTFATNFLRNGGNLESLKRIMRHSDIKTTQRYLSLQTADLFSEQLKASPLDNYMNKVSPPPG
jgi:site-specific recombinase XerD